MNLYDLMGPMAIGAGAGVAYVHGADQPWFSLVVGLLLGVIAGAATFLKIRKAITRLNDPTEKLLALLYVGTFMATTAASYLVAVGSLALAKQLGV